MICSARLQVAERGCPLCEGVVRLLLIHKAWTYTIVCKVFGECHTTYTLKTSFIYIPIKSSIGTLYPQQKDYFFVLDDLSLYIYFPVAVKSRCPGRSVPPIYIFMYCWICSRSEYIWNTARWTLSNNQSINQSFCNIIENAQKFHRLEVISSFI